MPQLDQTGPAGVGPMSGRGMGSCGNGARRGWGCGFGMGFGCGRRRFISPKNEMAALEEEEKMLEEELAALREEKAALQAQK